MARVFAASSSQYLEIDSTPVTDVSVSMACHFIRASDTGGNECMGGCFDASATNPKILLYCRGGVSGDPVAFQIQNTAGRVDSSNSPNATGEWNSVVGTSNAANDSRSVYLNGTKTTATGANTLSAGIDRVSIGRIGHSSPSSYFDGTIAWFTIWAGEITDDDAAAFQAGVHPFMIRRSQLVFFAPLGGFDSGNDDDLDIVGGLQLTATNSPTTASHPGFLTYPQGLVQPSVFLATLPTNLEGSILAGGFQTISGGLG